MFRLNILIFLSSYLCFKKTLPINFLLRFNTLILPSSRYLLEVNLSIKHYIERVTSKSRHEAEAIVLLSLKLELLFVNDFQTLKNLKNLKDLKIKNLTISSLFSHHI